MKRRKICVVTGSRAEYGLLFWLMKGIQKEPKLELQIIATGMHLSPEFGFTYKEIEKGGFHINKKVEMLLSADTPSAISKSTGLAMIGFADAYADLKPDIVILLGDRFELFSAAFCAHVAKIPIAHISGGETTAGAFDEAIRHSITKMSWWHFVAADEYKRRVIQLGEDSKRVILVGGLGVDNIMKTPLLTKSELEKRIGFKFSTKNLLVTFHPVTLEEKTAKDQCIELLNALERLNNTQIIFTYPNADTDGRIIKKLIDLFTKKHADTTAVFPSLGQLNYLSTLQYVDGLVGNSSSGLAEAPTFKIGTINIGDRQKGRLKAKSIIDCKSNQKSISEAIERLYSNEFQDELKTVQNPYGDGNATDKILDILTKQPVPKELKKEFIDL